MRVIVCHNTCQKMYMREIALQVLYWSCSKTKIQSRNGFGSVGRISCRGGQRTRHCTHFGAPCVQRYWGNYFQFPDGWNLSPHWFCLHQQNAWPYLKENHAGFKACECTLLMSVLSRCSDWPLYIFSTCQKYAANLTKKRTVHKLYRKESCWCVAVSFPEPYLQGLSKGVISSTTLQRNCNTAEGTIFLQIWGKLHYFTSLLTSINSIKTGMNNIHKSILVLVLMRIYMLAEVQ